MARLVRPLGSGRQLIAAAVAAFLGLAHAAAQPAATYDALLDEYAAGDASTAIRSLAAWNPSAIAAASGSRARGMTAARQRVAVMLHTDTAYASLMARRDAMAAAHLAAARRVFSAMKTGVVDPRTPEFEHRWFAFVATMFTAHQKLDQASFTVRDGLGLYPRDGRLYVARGAIYEMTVTIAAADPRSGNQLRRNGRWLDLAAADYRRAIASDDALATAHLHLGWVRLAEGDDRGLRDLEAALARADDDRDRYLAHLFLGRFAEQHEKLDEARREYEAAMAVGPLFQTAFVALGRVEEALGRPARARQLAAAYAVLTDKREDPWWDYYLGGFDQISLEWLRQEARRP